MWKTMLGRQTVWSLSLGGTSAVTVKFYTFSKPRCLFSSLSLQGSRIKMHTVKKSICFKISCVYSCLIYRHKKCPIFEDPSFYFIRLLLYFLLQFTSPPLGLQDAELGEYILSQHNALPDVISCFLYRISAVFSVNKFSVI